MKKSNQLQVGYNLGPVVITLAEYADVENIDGVTTANISQGQQSSVRLSTKF